MNGTYFWGVCDGPNSHQLAGWDFFVPRLAAKPQEPMVIARVDRSQQLLQNVHKIPSYLQQYWNTPKSYFANICDVDAMIYGFKYHFPFIMYTISWNNRLYKRQTNMGTSIFLCKVSDNVQLTKYDDEDVFFVTGRGAVQDGCQLACWITCSSYLVNCTLSLTHEVAYPKKTHI